MKNIMVRAHKLAAKMEGNYAVRLSLGLRIAWAESKKEEDGMELEQLISICEISYAGDNRVYCGDRRQAEKHMDEIKTHKPEIIQYLLGKQAAEEAAHAEREAKIAAIEGLEELQDAIDAWDTYHYEFNRRMDDENLSSILPARPEVSVKDMAAKYPRAAAYIKAKGWSYASNYAKAGAGKKAVERIINGEDHEQVISEMDAEWTAHCNANIWN